MPNIARNTAKLRPPKCVNRPGHRKKDGHMSVDHRNAASSAAGLATLPRRVVDFVPISKASAGHGGTGEESGFDLIDHAAEMIRASEQRALHAEEKAEKVSAKAVEAVRAAQLRIEQSLAQARLIEQHASEQMKLADERIAKAEALTEDRVAQAEAWAQAAEERARAAESRLGASEARANDAEERLEHLNQALRRKLPSVAGRAPDKQKDRILN
jgi:hypothetical protein